MKNYHKAFRVLNSGRWPQILDAGTISVDTPALLTCHLSDSGKKLLSSLRIRPPAPPGSDKPGAINVSIRINGR